MVSRKSAPKVGDSYVISAQRGQNQEASGRKVGLNSIYVGFVKENRDVQKMGRLRVWIPALSGNNQDESEWYTVSYCSPFAGASPIDNVPANPQSTYDYTQTQTSYGMWFVPPDLENEVICAFIDGSPHKGIWFGCLYQQYMNHMVPGIASNTSFGNDPKPVVPVAEYNKKDRNAPPPDPLRAAYAPLTQGLQNEGLLTDTARGPSTASARRDQPAQVYGFLTPRGHQIYVDDGSLNSIGNGSVIPPTDGNTIKRQSSQRTGSQEYIRFRTRGGAQVVINDTTGFVYANSKNGNSWLEISDDGINVYTSQNINMRAQQNFNLRVDGDFNLEVLGRTNWRNIGTVVETFQANHETTVGGTRHDTAIGPHHTLSNARIFRDAPRVDDNQGGSQAAQKVMTNPTQDRKLQAPDYSAVQTNSIIPKGQFVYHEPWDPHTITSGGKITSANPAILPSANDFSGDNSDGSQSDASKQNTKTQASTTTPKDTATDFQDNGTPVDVNGINVPQDAAAAICQASANSGVDYGNLMAIANHESGFDTNAVSPTGATGLFQFTQGTWNAMQQQGNTNGLGVDGRKDPYANAQAGAALYQQNETYLANKLGRQPTLDEIYMAHNIGPGRAAAIAQAKDNGQGDLPLDQIGLSDSALTAIDQQGSLYKSGGQYRTVNEAYKSVDNSVGKYAAGFDANKTCPGPSSGN